MKRMVACAFVLALTAAAGGAPLPQEAERRDPVLVDAAWLAARRDSAGILVVQVDYHPRAFALAHLPKARFLEPSAFTTQGELGMELPAPGGFEAALRAIGARNDSRIVIYGETQLAARLLLTLEAFGHRTVSLLDGGLEAWRRAGLPLSREATRAARGDFRARPTGTVVVEGEWVRARLGTAGIALIDTRTEAEYLGTDTANHAMHSPGHLAGARRIEWESLIDPASGRFLPRDRLAGIFRRAGASPTDTVVTYCMIGRRASVTYFAARLLGYEARLYDGSIHDWSRRRYPTVRP